MNNYMKYYKYEYNCDEELVNINLDDYNINGITKDHKVFAIKKNDFENGIRTPEWYPIDELNINDYLAILN